MSMLRSAIEELTTEPLSDVDDAQLEADLVEMRRTVERLESEFVRRVAEVDRRASYSRDGILSTTAFLKHRCGMAASTARERVRVARALEDMPHTSAAFATGDLGYAKVRLLTTAVSTDPATFRDHEESLVHAIAELTVRQARDVVDHWRQAAQPQDAAERAQAIWEQRNCGISSTFAGAVVLDATFDPVEGDIVATAIRSASASSDKGAARASRSTTPTQRRADALVEICRRYLDRGAPVAGGERPHINLTVDLETLEQRSGRLCATTNGVIDPESARMLACDAKVSRIITKGRSEPLDVGRATRTIPAGIRRALNLRDGGCQHPDCDRPPEWCDAHHIIHWILGGPTALGNLRLLCRRHHRMAHWDDAAKLGLTFSFG